jgi:hypothetical protein
MEGIGATRNQAQQFSSYGFLISQNTRPEEKVKGGMLER